MTSATSIKALVTGRVQGVYFRAYTRKQAQALDLTGYAKNLQDGRVEVLACGEQTNVDKMLKWLWQGSPHANVEHVVSTVVEISGETPKEFDIY